MNMRVEKSKVAFYGCAALGAWKLMQLTGDLTYGF